VPLWSLTDLDRPRCRYLFIAMRLIQAVFFSWNVQHPDEYWQSMEPAYNMVYGGVQLPWEWSKESMLRSTIYPFYLSLPLYLLKATGLDSSLAVMLCPKLAHLVLVLLCDLFMWRVGLATVGKNAARVSMLLMALSTLYNDVLVRCFTNSVETTFQIVAFYYYLKAGPKFNINIVLLTASLSLSFMIRNSSPVGWPPLIAIKIF